MTQPDPSSANRPRKSPSAAESPARKTGTEEPGVSKPGGFKNDPDDAGNPNEAIERHRRKVRPNGPG